MVRSRIDQFRSALEAFNRGDIEAALEDVDPAVEWHTPGILPDSQTYYGHDGVRAWADTMGDAFADLRLEPQSDFRELDTEHVLVEVRASGRGRESGIEVKAAFFMLATGREKLARMEFFPTEQDALAAAGHG